MIMYHARREIDMINYNAQKLNTDNDTKSCPQIGLSDIEKDILTAELYIRSVSRADEILMHHYMKSRRGPEHDDPLSTSSSLDTGTTLAV